MTTRLATYATLRDARDELLELTSTNTDADEYLLNAIRWASARIDELTAHVGFTPVSETRYFDARGNGLSVGGTVLYLPRPLLEVTTLTDGYGLTRTENTDFAAYPRGETPILALRAMDTGNLLNWAYYNDDWRDAISIAGVWGWHRNYSSAWLSSGDTVQNITEITAAGTTLTVSGASAADVLGRAPRFSPGQLLRIGSEYLAVTAVSANNLTVVRGQGGTTAAAHAHGAAIDIWEVDTAIQRACIRWAAFLHARRGAFEQASVDAFGTINRFPADMPGEVESILSNAGVLAKVRFAL